MLDATVSEESIQKGYSRVEPSQIHKMSTSETMLKSLATPVSPNSTPNTVNHIPSQNPSFQNQSKSSIIQSNSGKSKIHFS